MVPGADAGHASAMTAEQAPGPDRARGRPTSRRATRLATVAALVTSVTMWVPSGHASSAEAGVVPLAAPSRAAVREASVEPMRQFGWPLDGRPMVTRPFDPPPRRWLPGHRGVDLAGASGEVVRAAGAGVVRFAGPVAGRGVVSIEHAGGLRTTYEPLTRVVVAGTTVARGDPVGVLAPGHAGCPRPACLHWGLRHGEYYLDPLSLVGLGTYRLLPVQSPRPP